MPFPFFAHQAAVLPFKLRWPRLSGTGLVIGSIAPDFGYFLVGASVTRDWHRPHGVLLYCLPVGMVVYLLVTRVLAAPVAVHLPRLGRFRLHELALLEAQPRTLSHFAMVAACIVAGGGTHLAWDLFTHDGSWMGGHLPWLAGTVLDVRGHIVRGSNVLWIASTLVGGAFTLYALREIGDRRLLRRWAEARAPGSTAGIDTEAPPAHSHLHFWWPLVVTTAWAATLAYVERPEGFGPWARATMVIVFLRAASVGALALAWSAWRERRAWRHRSSGARPGTRSHPIEPAA